jgi:hypothetical protein
MTGAALVDIAPNTAFVQMVPVSQACIKTWGMALVGVQSTGMTMPITEWNELGEVVVVEVDHRIAEAVEATEMTLTTTRGATLAKKRDAIMTTTMGEVVLGVIAEIVIGDVRAEGTVRRGDHRGMGLGADQEIETGRDQVDVQEVDLLEDQEVDQGSDVIAGTGTVLVSDCHQVHSTATIGTKEPGTLTEEQTVVLVRIQQAEQIAAPMERLRSHGNVAAVAARGVGRAVRRSVGLVVEAEALLLVLKVLPENN